MLSQRFQTLPSILLLAIAPLISSSIPAFGQSGIPPCQPPSPGEYLLLVVSPTVNNQQQLRKALPPEIKTVSCKYLKDKTVMRIGGFKTIDDANRWARYLNNIVGLPTIITTRPKTPTAATTPKKPTTTPKTPVAATTPKKPATPKTPVAATTPQAITYNPKILGDGYAVLVDYFNRPELVNNVQKAVGGNVGFVSYGQRPYLLAVYTTNQREAYNTLKKLNEGGFFALLADGRKVMLLRSVVKL
ncbi:hypothetical protein VB711_25515 [Cronbergia sp. UHCC 0137]|uniref:hypothetical protein n=1 Tax=Cronbergia sp. UHCC 0137 TaxID=3110239 RepID=UPI002B20EAB0|nr:hypothetical protein [Cronbergia sp. UHCC 0137]MEA5621167.1 hypothetical protein [Cronbergia sp. UHCC 0137]